MRVAVLFKRRYMGHDVIHDRYARLYELPAGVARRGHQVVGVCLGYRPSDRGLIAEASHGDGSLAWYGLDLGRLVVPGAVSYLHGAWRLLSGWRPHVLLGGSDALHVTLTRVFARRLGIPYVIDLYDNFESFGLTRLLGLRRRYRQALRGAAAITAVSAPLAEYVGELAGGPPVLTLESTVDPRVFVPQERRAARTALGLPHAGRLVGICGAMDRRRGIGTVYRACLAVLDALPDCHLVLVGDPDRHSPPPRHPRVHQLGRLDHGRMPVFYAALDLALAPMRDDDFGRYAFPQKAYEILACRVPILTADLGALGRLLRGYPACLYRADDAVDLAAKVRGQLDQPCCPALPIPSWDEQAGRLEGLLREVVAQGGVQRA